MLLSREDSVRLRHILDAAVDAVTFAEGKTRRDLDADKQLALSMARCLEIIGEGAARVSMEVRDNTPQISWVVMIGMRNRLVHAYFDVNLTIVWKTVTDELPVLIGHLEQLVGGE